MDGLVDTLSLFEELKAFKTGLVTAFILQGERGRGG